MPTSPISINGPSHPKAHVSYTSVIDISILSSLSSLAIFMEKVQLESSTGLEQEISLPIYASKKDYNIANHLVSTT
jgi:hypothetical protein